jgi:hypothetical protein
MIGCSGDPEGKRNAGAVPDDMDPQGGSGSHSASSAGNAGGSSGTLASGDEDGDGVTNGQDNCIELANPDQQDRDGDGVGDACDNCAIVANSAQEEVVCKAGMIGEDDSDGDRVKDAEDNCALLANYDQTNSDGDLFGDACDNCPAVANDDQGNVDGDLLGDECDEDLSNEELCAEGSSRAEPLKPNLYFLFDTSGSMESKDYQNLGAAVTGAARGEDGIEGTADDLVNDFNVGVGTYPSALGGVCIFEPRTALTLKEGNSSRSLISVVPKSGTGGTPTAAALSGTFDRQLFVLPGELPSTRPAAIVLMTDGSPNDCGGQAGTVQQAARFAAIGVPVYVIAYDITGDELRQATEVARAGSVDRTKPQAPLEASDAAGIEAAFAAIRTEITSCTFPFKTGANANFERLDVLLHVGTSTTELGEGSNGYELGIDTKTVTLTGTACAKFQQNVGNASVELRVACKAQCVPTKEICDFRDNDCDGDADEGCSATPPEVCNGVDDDADGKVDEGCPTVVL